MFWSLMLPHAFCVDRTSGRGEALTPTPKRRPCAKWIQSTRSVLGQLWGLKSEALQVKFNAVRGTRSGGVKPSHSSAPQSSLPNCFDHMVRHGNTTQGVCLWFARQGGQREIRDSRGGPPQGQRRAGQEGPLVSRAMMTGPDPPWSRPPTKQSRREVMDFYGGCHQFSLKLHSQLADLSDG